MLILIGYQNSRTIPRSLTQKIMKMKTQKIFLVLVFDLVFSLFVLILAATEILNSYVN